MRAPSKKLSALPLLDLFSVFENVISLLGNTTFTNTGVGFARLANQVKRITNIFFWKFHFES
jgi:hypothetical protein